MSVRSLAVLDDSPVASGNAIVPLFASALAEKRARHAARAGQLAAVSELGRAPRGLALVLYQRALAEHRMRRVRPAAYRPGGKP